MTLTCDLLDRRRFVTEAETGMTAFAFIEGFFDPSRRHSAIGYRSPVDYETGVLAR